MFAPLKDGRLEVCQDDECGQWIREGDAVVLAHFGELLLVDWNTVALAGLEADVVADVLACSGCGLG